MTFENGASLSIPLLRPVAEHRIKHLRRKLIDSLFQQALLIEDGDSFLKRFGSLLLSRTRRQPVKRKRPRS